MNVEIRNAIIFHGDKILQLNTMNTDKYGAYKHAVVIMLTTVKTVVNAMKNETDPDVLFKSLAEYLGKEFSSILSANDDSDPLETVEKIFTLLQTMDVEIKEHRGIQNERYGESLKRYNEAMEKIKLSLESVPASHINVVKETKTEETNGNA